jgi:hypothetical protein
MVGSILVSLKIIIFKDSVNICGLVEINILVISKRMKKMAMESINGLMELCIEDFGK